MDKCEAALAPVENLNYFCKGIKTAGEACESGKTFCQYSRNGTKRKPDDLCVKAKKTCSEDKTLCSLPAGYQAAVKRKRRSSVTEAPATNPPVTTPPSTDREKVADAKVQEDCLEQCGAPPTKTDGLLTPVANGNFFCKGVKTAGEPCESGKNFCQYSRNGTEWIPDDLCVKAKKTCSEDKNLCSLPAGYQSASTRHLRWKRDAPTAPPATPNN